MSENVKRFLQGLDDLSRECGIWVETPIDARDQIILVDTQNAIVASGLALVEDTQQYVVDLVESYQEKGGCICEKKGNCTSSM